MVRAKLAHEAETSISEWPASWRDRFAMIEGDAAAMDLGLSGAEFRSLTGEIDRIHHAAQVTYLGVDRRTAQQLNVGGASEIIELAKSCSSLKCLVFHSTTDVAGDRTGLVPRRRSRSRAAISRRSLPRLEPGPKSSLAEAMGSVPIAVVRPATLVGSSTTGEIDRFDGPYLLILLIVTSPAEIAVPLPGKGDTPLNLVPIDYVVRASHADRSRSTCAWANLSSGRSEPSDTRRESSISSLAPGAGVRPAATSPPTSPKPCSALRVSNDSPRAPARS